MKKDNNELLFSYGFLDDKSNYLIGFVISLDEDDDNLYQDKLQMLGKYPE